jgi:hypothetical protein
MKQKMILAGVVAGLFCASPVAATTINFDDLQSIFITSAPIVNPYAGFNWNNVYVISQTDIPGSGFEYGVVSATNASFNGYSGDAGFSPVSGSFTLNSADFTGGYGNQQAIITGYINGVQVDTATFALTETTPVLHTFNWIGLTSVTYGGTGGAGYVVIDNLTVNGATGAVPEISTWAMMLAGFAAVGFVSRRRRVLNEARLAA